MANDLELTCYPAQRDFIMERTAPYIGFVGGRGAGKSVACAIRLLLCASEQRGLWGMYAPTFPLLRDTIQRVFEELAKPYITRIHGQPATIELWNGSEILCRSLDDPERARGPSLRGAVWDEASLCDKSAFDILIACLRYEGKQGWLAASFTPRGPAHWTATVFNDPARTDVKCFHAPTTANPFNPPNFADTLRRQYTSAYAEQEIEGRFVSLSAGLMKRHWFKIIPATEVPARFDCLLRYWDMAATVESAKTPDPDWTAGVKIGYVSAGNAFYVLDLRHERMTPAQSEEMLRNTAVQDGFDCFVRMEEEGGSSGKNQTYNYASRVLRGFNFRGCHQSDSKIMRANPVSAAAEHGFISLVEAPWNAAFLDECESFGPDCPHDDIVDALSGAYNEICKTFIRPGVGGNGYPAGTGMAIDKADEEIQTLLLQIKNGSPADLVEADRIMREGGLR